MARRCAVVKQCFADGSKRIFLPVLRKWIGSLESGLAMDWLWIVVGFLRDRQRVSACKRGRKECYWLLFMDISDLENKKCNITHTGRRV
jgi:hypothetical protein